MTEITVVSFLWGTWYKRGKEYLETLRKSIQRNTSYPLKFVCITNRKKKNIAGWEVRPLQSPSSHNNLRKLALYNPANRFHGRLLVVDLDIVICGSLNTLLDFEGEFLLKGRHKFPEQGGKYELDGDIFVHNVNKLRWERNWKWIKENIKMIEQRTRGRERFFYRRYGKDLWPDLKVIQEEFPGLVVSFKKDRIRDSRRIPDGSSIISFHGKVVKPHMIDWIVKEYWK